MSHPEANYILFSLDWRAAEPLFPVSYSLASASVLLKPSVDFEVGYYNVFSSLNHALLQNLYEFAV